jgi:hypothetical protein
MQNLSLPWSRQCTHPSNSFTVIIPHLGERHNRRSKKVLFDL